MDQSTPGNVMMSGYMEAAVRSWSDEEYKRRLADNPREALAESGWVIPTETEVEVAFVDPAGRDSPSADALTEAWAAGIQNGQLRVVISDRAPDELETSEVSEDQLGKISAGHCVDGYCGPCL